MKRHNFIVYFFIILSIMLITDASTADSQELPCAVGPKAIRAYSVANSDSICLMWPTNDLRQELRVSRRVYTNHPSAWQNWVEIYNVTNQVNEAGEYCDTNVSSGIHYEYKITALTKNWTCPDSTNRPVWSFQYINTGTEVPLNDQRGKVILLVESSFATPLANELATLEDDIVGDGYKVYRHEVAASEVTDVDWKTNVANTKALIRSDYNTDINADWSIFIIGHVPIPYSGLVSPGSHTDNYGAHPADWYYADMNETVWTDTTANDTTSAWLHHWNVPGDGKFDQSFMPSAPELRIGRVDLKNMPAFGKSEVELIRQYMNRNHAWRHKQFTARDRGLVYADGFPFESHSIYSSFFGGVNYTDLASWLRVANNSESSYLFAASSGSGSYTKDNKLGYTTDFAATPLYAVFTSMYGSYFGDWDSAMHPNVVLLAPIADEGYAVSVFYRENVANIDSSSMGEPIGQELFAMGSNNFPAFNARYLSYGWIYNGSSYVVAEKVKNYATLMGDPTLRMRVVAPPRNAVVSIDGADNVISWTSAADTNIQGYHVYRAPTTNHNDFTRITSTPVTTGSFRDVNAATGAYRYMVRTVKLEQSASRSYYSASQGIFATNTSYDNTTEYNKADKDHNHCVDIEELSAFISRWYISSTDVTMRDLMETIGFWKRGC
jgi:hypothetical protein